MDLQELSDRAAIHALLVRYCDCIDGRDIDRLAAEIYTQDAVDDHGWGPWSGVDAILDGLRPVLDRFGGTAHLLSNVQIEMTEAGARGRTGVTAWHWAPGNEKGTADFVAVGVYTDTFVRTDVGWRIKHRTFGPIGPTIKAAGTLPPALRIER
jgi:hypothetical protein